MTIVMVDYEIIVKSVLKDNDLVTVLAGPLHDIVSQVQIW